MVDYNDPLTDISTWKKRSPYFIKAGSPEAKKYPGFKPRSEETEGLLIEYDVAVPLRDGVKMYVDIYRPANKKNIPIVIAWTPVHPIYSFNGSMGSTTPHRSRRFHSILVSTLPG